MKAVRVSETVAVHEHTRVRVWDPWYLSGPQEYGTVRADVFIGNRWAGSIRPRDGQWVWP